MQHQSHLSASVFGVLMVLAFWSSALFPLLVPLGVAAQSQINWISFSAANATCTGSNSTQTFNGGACQASGGAPAPETSVEYYCSADGSFVYSYRYMGPSCNGSALLTISQTPTRCGFLAPYHQVTCVNPSAGPAAPLSFPPAGPGWGMTTQCYDSSLDPQKSGLTLDCHGQNDPAYNCMQTAFTLNGACISYVSTNQQSSSIKGCTADGSSLATIVFSDTNCQTAVGVSLQPSGSCFYGSNSTCTAGSYIIPDSKLPKQGYSIEGKLDCSPDPIFAPKTYLFYDDSCYQNSKFSCYTVNNVSTGYLAINGTNPDQCPIQGVEMEIQPSGVFGASGKKFICPNNSPPGPPSSSTGSSNPATSSGSSLDSSSTGRGNSATSTTDADSQKMFTLFVGIGIALGAQLF